MKRVAGTSARIPRAKERVSIALILLALVQPAPAFAAHDGRQEGGFRSAALTVPRSGKPGFATLSSTPTGISFTNRLSEIYAANNQILESGSGVALGDADGDGWCDVYLCGLEGPNRLFRNLGNWKFEDISAPAGVACDNQFSTGAAFADVDGDGDLDLLVNGIGVGTRLFTNQGQGQFVEAKDTGLIKRFGSTSLALADVEGDGDLDWYVTNYRTDSVRSAPPGLRIEAKMVNGRLFVTPEDRFTGLLLAGGGVEVIEKGEPDVFYLNNGQGKFERWNGPPWTAPVTRDQTTLLALTLRPGHPVLLSGASNYEDGLAVGASARQYDPLGGKVEDALPAQLSSVGPMAAADIDGDGDLDLFAGGRVLPGRYPEPASSMVYLNHAGKFHADAKNSKPFEKLALISGAVFSDLDADGDPDLILASEWGPVRFFLNDAGIFKPWNAPVTLVGVLSTLHPQLSTLSQLTGWWNGVTTGDFDGDGHLDIAASNWGRNTRVQPFLSKSWQVYYGDLDNNGTVEIIEAFLESSLNKTVPWRARDVMARAVPSVGERFNTVRDYARAGVGDIFGEKIGQAGRLQINTLDSMVFLNRGGKFEARSLPLEAQFAPALGLTVGDCDGDGAEDLFLAQNFFAAELETSRYDAGRGLWLRGDGRGGFQPVPGQESGVLIYGEQRGAALCDFDADGRVDLAVAQNRAPTKVFRNQGAKAGLRVKLKGPEGNPTGIGAVLRLKYGERFGPVREIHAGSGYWSQEGSVQVMGLSAAATEVWVRWSGGKVTTSPIPANAREVVVEFPRSGRTP